MNADSYFEIGNTHLVCQDYALSGNYKDLWYGIISDGCSSAKYSEIGAQILCHGAQYCLALNYDLFKERQINTHTLRKLLGNSILKRADEVRKLYPISYEALQATLFITVLIDDHFYVFGWGDGCVISVWDKETQVVEIDYPDTNAPFYLSTDRAGYINKFGIEKNVRHVGYFNNDHRREDLCSFDLPFLKTYNDACAPNFITVCSDGVTQFQDEKRSGYVETFQMIPRIIDYPDTKGEFVKRTMNFLKRDLIKKSWSHADDFSVATVERKS